MTHLMTPHLYFIFRPTPAVLDLDFYGLSEADLSQAFVVGDAGKALFPEDPTGVHNLSEIVSRLNSVYCQSIGYEYMYIQEKNRCEWLRSRIEGPQEGYSADQKIAVARGLAAGHGFEAVIEKKFGTEKRFGVDGCESLIPGMQQMIEQASSNGVKTCIIGMPHRGRLNVLCNVMQKPIEKIFNEFAGLTSDDDGSGDVKYHLGISSDVDCKSGNPMHLSLLANPSHLEAVDPVVEGKARAEQLLLNDPEGKQVMPVLLHGDAAFAGQGVVFETFGMANLNEYKTGGTVHIVVNNQVGFTTDPRHARSSMYCTDVAKASNAPIFHVNGDDVEAVTKVFELAVDYRQEFGTDVVIDIVCFRRNGHNETDQPEFTQPMMYSKIKEHPGAIHLYKDQLVAEGVAAPEDVEKMLADYDQTSSEAFDNAKEYETEQMEFFNGNWSKIQRKQDIAKIYSTGIELEELTAIASKFSEVPDDVNVHPTLKRILKARVKAIEEDDINWATGEALAFGSLLLEGTHVRLSGQDVERGTFSHRHHVVHDQAVDGKTYCSLANLGEEQAPYTVSNSHLSEYAVLGFELGYSGANPNQLVCWEAQFGDFANTAQCIIDQFVSSGQAKWGRQSGLVMLLPHGYEGMGPEHSSARLERFLQMCDDDEDVYPEMDMLARTQIERCNWQVVNPTTPANIFHLLRRQVHRDFRKPLVVMTPKSLLNHPEAKSSMEDMGPGTLFRRMYPEMDESIHAGGDAVNSDVRRLIFCSGKVYYDLLKEREERGITDVALARVEQISPFPFDLVHRHAENFPEAEIVWAQEEPRNMGGWSYVDPRIETALRDADSHAGGRARYVGRAPSASTATGDKTVHKLELKQLLSDAFE